MNAQHHRELQQAHQRIARNRRALQSTAARLSQSVHAKLNWRANVDRHPVAMVLGALGLGLIASRILPRFGTAQGIGQLLRWARRYLRGNLLRELLQMRRPRRHPAAAEDAS